MSIYHDALGRDMDLYIELVPVNHSRPSATLCPRSSTSTECGSHSGQRRTARKNDCRRRQVTTDSGLLKGSFIHRGS